MYIASSLDVTRTVLIKLKISPSYLDLENSHKYNISGSIIFVMYV